MLNDLIADNIPMGVILTQDGRICHINKWAQGFMGYANEDVQERSFLDLVHPDDHEHLIMRYNAVMTGKDAPRDRRYRIMSKEGKIFQIMFRSSVVEYEGKPALMSYLIDETKSWEYEESLKKSEEKYRALVDNIAEGIVVICDQKICFINKTIRNLLGQSLEEMSRIPIMDFFHPDDQAKMLERHRRRMSGEEVSESYEARLRAPAGTEYICEIRSTAITWEGKPAVQVAILDLTESRKAEEEKKQLEKRLVRMEKMEALGLLAGGVAHDLNNVLSGVVSYPELLLMDLPKDHPFVKPLDLIHSSGRKATAIVEDLLTLARRGVMAPVVINLNTIILDYLRSSGHQTMMSYHSEIMLETDLAPNLLNIKGSEVHLQKTIMNLVTNAAEAQPSGGSITISTQNRYVDTPISGYDSIEQGEYVLLIVEDSGIGISSRDMQQIFEPFYTKKVMGRSGTGLGMAVVWGTVQDHFGYINVESLEDKGSKFFLYFPVFRDEVADKSGPLPLEEYVGNKEKILVVDDVKDQREIATSILNRLNYEVETVGSGEEAIKYMAQNSCDLLLLDMIMAPGIDGLETYKEILKIHPGQKAVIASGFSEDKRVKKIQSLGAGRYLKKPYSVEQIGIVLKEELRR